MSLTPEPLVFLAFVVVLYCSHNFVRELRNLRDDYDAGQISEGLRNSHHITIVLIMVMVWVAYVLCAWPIIEPLLARFIG